MSRVTQVQNFARAGYLARAIVYFLIGYIALTTGRGSGATDILSQIEEMPAGHVVLALVGLGLLGYGVFRIYGAAIDIEGGGTTPKGIAKRLGHVASGLGHLFLAYVAIKTAFGAGSGGFGTARRRALGPASSSSRLPTASAAPAPGRGSTTGSPSPAIRGGCYRHNWRR